MALNVNRMFARKFVASVIAAALLTFPSMPASAKADKNAEPAGGRILGKIFAVDGKTPVPGATVRAVPLQGEKAAASAPSDAKGQFELSGLAFGYFDLVVEAPGGTFIANQVVNVPPAGKLVVQFSLTPYDDKSPSWWAGREPRPLPGGGTATGSAEMRQSPRGAEFWKSPKGIAVLAGIGGAVLLAIAVSGGGGGSSNSVSPSTNE